MVQTRESSPPINQEQGAALNSCIDVAISQASRPNESRKVEAGLPDESAESELAHDSDVSDNDESCPSAALQGLKLDIAEPWERSLLRLLQEGKASFSPAGVMTSTTRPFPEQLMLIGRSDSRDYVFEIEGQHDDNKKVPSRNTGSSRTALASLALLDDSYDEEISSYNILRKFPSADIENADRQQQAEARGEQNASDRDNNKTNTHGLFVHPSDSTRSFSLRKARAVREEDNVWFLDVNDKELPRPPMPDLRLPLL